MYIPVGPDGMQGSGGDSGGSEENQGCGWVPVIVLIGIAIIMCGLAYAGLNGVI